MSQPSSSTGRPPLLRLHDGECNGGLHAPADVGIERHAGQVHCLVGENGSGKSTLMKIVSGVVRLEPGSIVEFGGQPVEHLTLADAKRHGVQVIYQDLSPFPNLTVAENIGFDRNLSGILARPAQARAAASAGLQRIGVCLDLDETVQHMPIAQRRIVAIARARAADARMLIMDEPTAFTRTEVDHLLSVVREKASGRCVVFASHRLEEIRAIADHATVLRDGRKVGAYPAAELTRDRISELMTGQRFGYEIEPRLSDGRPIVLDVDGLTRAGYAETHLLITILAAVLGGIDPFGGFGRVLGLVTALCILQVISTGFNLPGFSPQLTLAIWGSILIAVLALQALRPKITSMHRGPA